MTILYEPHRRDAQQFAVLLGSDVHTATAPSDLASLLSQYAGEVLAVLGPGVELGDALAIALLGTLTAAVLAFPVGFLAAKNVVPNIFAHFAVRRVLDVFRGVDVLIWALIFINVVGCGIRVPNGIRQNRCHEIESATSRHSDS